MANPQVTIIDMVEGDTLPLLTFTYQGVNVTGYTFLFNARRGDKTTLSRTGTITNAATGSVSFVWLAGDIALPEGKSSDLQMAEIEVTSDTGAVMTVPNLALRVTKSVK